MPETAGMVGCISISPSTTVPPLLELQAFSAHTEKNLPTKLTSLHPVQTWLPSVSPLHTIQQGPEHLRWSPDFPFAGWSICGQAPTSHTEGLELAGCGRPFGPEPCGTAAPGSWVRFAVSPISHTDSVWGLTKLHGNGPIWNPPKGQCMVGAICSLPTQSQQDKPGNPTDRKPPWRAAGIGMV